MDVTVHTSTVGGTFERTSRSHFFAPSPEGLCLSEPRSVARVESGIRRAPIHLKPVVGMLYNGIGLQDKYDFSPDDVSLMARISCFAEGDMRFSCI